VHQPVGDRLLQKRRVVIQEVKVLAQKTQYGAAGKDKRNFLQDTEL